MEISEFGFDEQAMLCNKAVPDEVIKRMNLAIIKNADMLKVIYARYMRRLELLSQRRALDDQTPDLLNPAALYSSGSFNTNLRLYHTAGIFLLLACGFALSLCVLLLDLIAKLVSLLFATVALVNTALRYIYRHFIGV